MFVGAHKPDRLPPTKITGCADITAISQMGVPPDTFLKGQGGSHAVSVTEAAKRWLGRHPAQFSHIATRNINGVGLRVTVKPIATFEFGALAHVG
jgi:hypothetical protein